METIDEKLDVSLRSAAIEELVDELEKCRDVVEGMSIGDRYGRQRWLLYDAGELDFDLELVDGFDGLRAQALDALERAVEIVKGRNRDD